MIKKYGCCFFNHGGVDALLRLMEEHNIHYDAVESVKVEIPTFITKMLRFPDPKNGEDAKFSLHESLGSLLADREMILAYIQLFTDSGAVDPRYKEARKKINVGERTDWSGGRSAPWSMPVTVFLKNGKQFTKAVEKDLKGGSENPLSKEELVAEHKVLVKGFLSSEQTQRTIDLIYNLEKLENVSELMKLAMFGKSKLGGLMTMWKEV